MHRADSDHPVHACIMSHRGPCSPLIHSEKSSESTSKTVTKIAWMRGLIWAFAVQKHVFTWLCLFMCCSPD